MGKAKLLIVDDDDDDFVLIALKKRLGPFYEIVTTEDPKAVVKLAAMERPRLILCDYIFEDDEMSGSDVREALRVRPDLAKIPIMFLTGLVTPSEARERGGMFEGSPCITKQTPTNEMIAAIEKMLV